MEIKKGDLFRMKLSLREQESLQITLDVLDEILKMFDKEHGSGTLLDTRTNIIFPDQLIRNSLEFISTLAWSSEKDGVWEKRIFSEIEFPEVE